MTVTDPRDDPAEALRRWEDSGGHWRVLRRSETAVVVGLFTCDGGEEMERVEASPSELDVVMAGRDRSHD